ncbi:hypothetical protein Ancab_038735 [Ancistrocladus abbreviatus]
MSLSIWRESPSPIGYGIVMYLDSVAYKEFINIILMSLASRFSDLNGGVRSYGVDAKPAKGIGRNLGNDESVEEWDRLNEEMSRN